MKVNFRPGNAEDLNFIKSSYLKSCRNNFDNNRMSNAVYFHNYGKAIQSIISRCKCDVACDPEYEQHIYGYILYEYIDDIVVIHYVYIKYPFRLLNIARKLVTFAIGEKDIVAITHTNKICDLINKKMKWHYNPFLRFYENKRD